jgi:hypothetical protein
MAAVTTLCNLDAVLKRLCLPISALVLLLCGWDATPAWVRHCRTCLLLLPVGMVSASYCSVGCVYSVLVVVGHLVCSCHGLRPVSALSALLPVLHARPLVHPSPVACWSARVCELSGSWEGKG